MSKRIVAILALLSLTLLGAGCKKDSQQEDVQAEGAEAAVQSGDAGAAPQVESAPKLADD